MVAVAVVLASVVAPSAPDAEQDLGTDLAADLTVPGGALVSLAESGPAPATVAVEPGQTVRWDNQASTLRFISAAGGQFASGPVEPGGGFAVAFPEPGTFRYAVEPGGHRGVVHVGTLVVDGPGTDPVDQHLVLRDFPELDPADVSTHPYHAWDASRTRILLGFHDATTVAEANGVLQRAGTPILGAYRGGLLLVGAPDTPDFSGLEAALGLLRGEPSVRFAAMDVLSEPDAIPDTSATFRSEQQYDWDVPAAPAGLGAGGNWHHETLRAPQAWNLREAAVDAPARPRVVVFDSGFDTSHPALAGIEVVELCYGDDGGSCVENRPAELNDDDVPTGNHGTHVAGVAAGAFGPGAVGVDPQASLVGVPFSFYRRGIDQVAELVERIEAGDLGDARVVNYSIGTTLDVEEWVDDHGDFTCGPGLGDDSGGTGPCTPSTDDRHLAEVAQRGEAVRPFLARLATRGVLWVGSTGNDAAKLCDRGGRLDEAVYPMATDCSWIPLEARSNSETNWAGATWDPADGPNPVVAVEALGTRTDSLPLGPATPAPSLDRMYFSNTAGTISSPGWMVGPAVGGGHQLSMGTSQAAPTVAGLAAYLAAQPSAPTMAEVRIALLTWVRRDAGNGAAPRADAFASVLSLPGAARHLVDVNDASADGNRRVVLGSGNVKGADDTVFDPADPGAFTAPDGVVDLRDFRRLRDAWLLLCKEGHGDVACPPAADIHLDGAVDHPKRDLNLDGCTDHVIVATARYCAEPEGTFPRFDFNGDGRLTLVDAVEVALEADGSPAPHPAFAVPMTDLQVLASQYDPPSPGQWQAGDLWGLRTSGDVLVAAGGLFAAGATGVVVTAVDATTFEAVVTAPADPATGEAVLTLPANRPVTFEAQVTRPEGQVLVEEPDAVQVGIGEDRRVDLCGGIRVTASPLTLEADGMSTTTVSAALDPCSAVPLEGVLVGLTVDPSGTGHAALADAAPPADTAGVATTTLTAGTEVTTYTVTAEATVDDGNGGITLLTGSTEVRVDRTFRYEALADTVGPLDVLGRGPSIDDAGDVAFAAIPDGSDDTGIYRGSGGGAPARVDAAGTLQEGERYYGEVHTAGDGSVYVLTERQAATSPSYSLYRRLLRLPPGGAPAEELALSHASFPSPSTTPLDFLGLPAPNDAGGWVAPAMPRGGAAPVPLIGPDQAGFVQGPSVVYMVTGDAADRANGAPDHADDGTTALVASYISGTDDRGLPTYDESVLVGRGVLGTDEQFVGYALATASEGWGALGVAAVSDDGDIVVFTGDRGDGPGLFLSHRGPGGGYTAPSPVLGENATSPVAELGTAPDGSERWLADIDMGGRIEVLHRPRGATGIEDDAVVVAFLGTPNAAGDRFSERPGLWTARVTMTPGGGTVFPVADVPDAVVQLGDTVGGLGAVDGVSIHDPLGEGGTEPFDHQVAWWQRSGDHEQVLKATWVAGDAAAGGTALETQPIGAVGPRSAATLTARLAAAGDTPYPAVRLSSLSPDTATAVTVTNRSRTGAGSPVAADVDPGDGSGARTLAHDGALTLSYPAGAATVTATVASAAGTLTTTVPLTVSAGANRPPVADAGGPYTAAEGAGVTLDGSASADPDAGDTVTLAWDLGGDGAFGDATGPTVVLGPEDLAAEVCGGACINGVAYPLALRASDAAGAVSTEETTFTVVGGGDFALSLSPASQPINPGGSTTFLVQISAVDNFAEEVFLTTKPLPAGWSASFRDTRVPPGEPTYLTVTAPIDAAEAPVDVVVVGTAGDRVHEAGTVASVTFALVPVCTGGVEVTVTDLATGLPLEGAQVVLSALSGAFSVPSVLTGADGVAVFADLPTPSRFSTSVSKADYGTKNASPFYNDVVCGSTTRLAVDLPPHLTGVVEGRVVEGIPDPDDLSLFRQVFPTGVPVEGAGINPGGQITGPDGTFRLEVTVTYGSTTLVRPRASKAGWWSSDQASVRLGEDGVLYAYVELAMVRQCTARLSGSGRVVDQDGDAVADSRVVTDSSWAQSAFSGADGAFALPARDVLLGNNNSRKTFSMLARVPAGFPPGSLASDRYLFLVSRCEPVHVDEVLQLTRAPEPRFGTVEGTITDVETGAAVAGASVLLRRSGDVIAQGTTDAAGFYRFAGVTVGTEPDDVLGALTVQASSFWHWGKVSGSFSLAVDETETVDLGLLVRKEGAVRGRVTDAATGLPIDGMRVGAGSANVYSAADGTYLIEGLDLGAQNVPKGYQVSTGMSPSDYFPASAGVTVSEGAVAVADFALIPLCSSATLTGLVVHADTHEPLEGVNVRISGHWSAPASEVPTDAGGRFLVSGITPGFENVPNVVSVTASKEGFITQTRFVTVFCGGTVTVDFGQPVGGLGAVVGTVTDAGTGLPLSGVFVGSGFGGSDTTGADGAYRLDAAPVNPDGSPRDWAVTAVAPDGRTASAVVTVVAGADTLQDFALASGPANRPPVADPQSVTTAAQVPVAITLTGSDPDGDAVSFAVTDPPVNGTLSGTAPNLTYTPAAGFSGTDAFAFVVGDPAGATSDPATVTVTVTPAANAPPTAVIAPVPAVVEGGEVVLDGTGSSDPDGDPLAYSWTVGGATYAGATVTLAFPDDTATTATLTVDDGRGGSAGATAEIVVANAPPALSVVAGPPVVEGRASSLDVAVADPGALDTHRLTVSWGDGTTESQDVAGGAALGHAYAAPGSFTATVEVCDDDGACDVEAAELVVTAIEHTLSVVVEAPPSAAVGDTVAYAVTATNTTPGPAPALVLDGVVDTLLGDLTAAAAGAGCASLVPGGSCAFPVTRTVAPGDPDPLVGTLTARYHPDGSAPGRDVSTSTDHAVDLFQPSVSVTVANPASAEVGDMVDYVVTFTDTSSPGAPPLVLDEAADTVLGDLTSAAVAAGCGVVDAVAPCTFTVPHTVALLPDPLTGTLTARFHAAGSAAEAAAWATHELDPVPRTRIQLTPTGTECPEFAAGTADDQEVIEYKASGGGRPEVKSAVPGAFILWTEVVAPSPDFAVEVVQSSDAGLALVPLVADGPKVFDAGCTPVTSGVSYEVDAGSTGVRVEVAGATPGDTFVVGVKYNPAALRGAELPAPDVVATYSYLTLVAGLATNVDTLVLRPR